MGYFIGFVDLKNTPGGAPNEWTVDLDLGYRSDAGDVITVYPGAQTDGASIPRLFWRLIGPPLGDRYTAAAVIHDLLYRTEGAEMFTRGDVDDLFHEMLMVLGVPGWKAWVMWFAVRIGGAASWRDDGVSAQYVDVRLAYEAGDLE